MFYVQTGRWAPRQPQIPQDFGTFGSFGSLGPSLFPRSTSAFSYSFSSTTFNSGFTRPQPFQCPNEEPYVESPSSTPAETPLVGTPRAGSPDSVFKIESVQSTPVNAPSPISWQTSVDDDDVIIVNKIEDIPTPRSGSPIEILPKYDYGFCGSNVSLITVIENPYYKQEETMEENSEQDEEVREILNINKEIREFPEVDYNKNVSESWNIGERRSFYSQTGINHFINGTENEITPTDYDINSTTSLIAAVRSGLPIYSHQPTDIGIGANEEEKGFQTLEKSVELLETVQAETLDSLDGAFLLTERSDKAAETSHNRLDDTEGQHSEVHDVLETFWSVGCSKGSVDTREKEEATEYFDHDCVKTTSAAENNVFPEPMGYHFEIGDNLALTIPDEASSTANRISSVETEIAMSLDQEHSRETIYLPTTVQHDALQSITVEMFPPEADSSVPPPVPEPIPPAQKHEYLSSAPPAVTSAAFPDPQPPSPSASTYFSTYNTPYTSNTSIYYSAQDLIQAVRKGVPIYQSEPQAMYSPEESAGGYDTDSTIPFTADEHDSEDIRTEDTVITDVYEMKSSGILSEEEEEPFQRNQSIRKSILPKSRKHPDRKSPDQGEQKSPESRGTRIFPVVSINDYTPHYVTTQTRTEVETLTETRTSQFRPRSPLHNKVPITQVPIRRDYGSGGRVLKMVTEMGSATIGGISPALSANAAKSFLEATDKEKKELQGLNDRLGNYIDRVKRLEEQNRKLVADLDELRGKWGKDTSEIKIKYSESLSTARKDIDDSARRKAEIDVKAARLRDDLAEYRSRYEDVQHRREADREKISQWTNAIADAQSELEMLRARWKQLTDEEKRLNGDNARIWEELQKARNDLDEETIGRIDFQNQVQTLMEELEFLRRVHEQEVKELQALLAQAPADTREFFKNELALAIRDIKDEYDYIAKQGKQDMESWYKLKVSEVQGSANRAAMESNYQREEVKRMRDNIGDLRGKLNDLENKNSLLEKEVQNLNYQLNDDQRQYEMALNDRDATLRRMREECQTLVAELQGLLDTKQMLDAEIAIYRKMLEGEESRVGLRQMVEQVVKTHSLQQQEDTDSTRSVRGEVSTKTTFQRSAKGNVTIAECDPNGKFITLENTHRTKEENLGEHKLKRKLDGNRREIVYTIPANTILKPGKTMKIYARDQGGVNSPPDSLVFEGENTWGIGANVVTSLINKEGEERATHTQKTIQTGQ